MEERPRPKKLSRREFLGTWAKHCVLLVSLAGPFSILAPIKSARAYTLKRGWGLIRTKLSPFYAPLEDERIRCELCPRECVVSEGELGTAWGRVHTGSLRRQEVYKRERALS